MLILDNYKSHVIIAFIDYVYKNKIVLFYLPSHSTHRLQSLNIIIFSLLAIYYSHEVNAYIYHKLSLHIDNKLEALLLLLSLLKEKKEYTSQPTTPEEQSNQPPPATPHIRIQQGTLPINLPINKTDEPKQ